MSEPRPCGHGRSQLIHFILALMWAGTDLQSELVPMKCKYILIIFLLMTNPPMTHLQTGELQKGSLTCKAIVILKGIKDKRP